MTVDEQLKYLHDNSWVVFIETIQAFQDGKMEWFVEVKIECGVQARGRHKCINHSLSRALEILIEEVKEKWGDTKG